MTITPATNHRGREKGVLVYPVYSRRSGGLSVGVNLFPAKKECPFDCPYCEVFPFEGNAVFSLEQMEADLRRAISDAHEQNIPVRDICFSGNGEPTLSPDFGAALTAAEAVRRELSASARLVVITNGAGLLNPAIFSLLKDAANASADIWLKLDAGTPAWYQKMNRTAIPFEALTEKIMLFVACAPVTIQTMLCAIDGERPPQTEARAWEALLCDVAKTASGSAGAASVAGNLRKVQLYGKARPAPEDPLASPLPRAYLEERAASLRGALAKKGVSAAVETYV
jgi:histidinol dehydrogenase